MLRCCAIALALFTASATADQRPLLSLVIDDLGYSLDNGVAAIELDGDHTYAILPGSTYAQRLAQHAHQRGKEIILHMPMQSIHSRAAQEPNALNEGMDEDQLTNRVHSLLESVPYIRGVNNHMGSHLTEFDFFMRPVMDSIRSYDSRLYFLDSRTSPISVAHAQALDAGLASIRRDVFLDNETHVESIYLQFREHGSAIAIGHPHSQTLEVLRANLSATKAGFEYLPVSRLIELRRVQAADSGKNQRAYFLDTAVQ
jgi:polysaccharide deacetylase 2 family uncharacterized protein YibQ